MTTREKVRLNQMLMSGDVENIELAFEIIISSKEDLKWLIYRLKDKLNGMTAFFQNKIRETEELIEDFYYKLYNHKDKFKMIETDVLDYEETLKYYENKLSDIKLKSDVFNLVFIKSNDTSCFVSRDSQ
jgi:hypothetical protein